MQERFEDSQPNLANTGAPCRVSAHSHGSWRRLRCRSVLRELGLMLALDEAVTAAMCDGCTTVFLRLTLLTAGTSCTSQA
jgi:hypothetical protein